MMGPIPSWIGKPMEWNVPAAGGVRVVKLGGSGDLLGRPKTFTSDGMEHSLGSSWRGRKSVSFEVAGRAAAISVSGVRPSWWRRYITALGDITGGSQLVMWRYELTVEGKSQGTWVQTFEGGVVTSWRFFEAGSALPDPNARA